MFWLIFQSFADCPVHPQHLIDSDSYIIFEKQVPYRIIQFNQLKQFCRKNQCMKRVFSPVTGLSLIGIFYIYAAGNRRHMHNLIPSQIFKFHRLFLIFLIKNIGTAQRQVFSSCPSLQRGCDPAFCHSGKAFFQLNPCPHSLNKKDHMDPLHIRFYLHGGGFFYHLVKEYLLILSVYCQNQLFSALDLQCFGIAYAVLFFAGQPDQLLSCLLIFPPLIIRIVFPVFQYLVNIISKYFAPPYLLAL